MFLQGLNNGQNPVALKPRNIDLLGLIFNCTFLLSVQLFFSVLSFLE